MSFIDDIVRWGNDILPTNNEPLEETISRTARLSELLNRIVATNSKENPKEVDDSRRRNFYTANVDPDFTIPVVYGTAALGGSVTDARMTNNCLTMWYCITICETTGALMSSGEDSSYTIDQVYWDSNRVRFQGDGFTVAEFVTPDGDTNTDVNGLIQIYFYGGDSATPLNGGPTAYSIFPEWTTNHNMTNLVFALVKIDYNPEKNVTKLGNLRFRITNSLKEPGDVLYDYMTNTRYGAGINPQEINGL